MWVYLPTFPLPSLTQRWAKGAGKLLQNGNGKVSKYTKWQRACHSVVVYGGGNWFESWLTYSFWKAKIWIPALELFKDGIVMQSVLPCSKKRSVPIPDESQIKDRIAPGELLRLIIKAVSFFFINDPARQNKRGVHRRLPNVKFATL